ncbi:MAG: hypothetical protein ACXVPD_03005, partial [Bacteroidia bacterium]
IADIYFEKKDYSSALNYTSRSLQASVELGLPENIRNGAQMAYKIYKVQNKGMQALEMHELYIKMRDSINNIETRKISLKSQFKYEFEKKELAVKTLARAKEEKLKLEAEADRQKRNIIIYCVLGGLLLVSVFLVLIYRSLQENKKANKIISQQKHIVEEKQKEILDSIRYARRIQSALITPEKYIDKTLTRLSGL